MKKTEKIIEYITEKYKPEAIITYGSFADGSENEHSDFDALVIADGEKSHDSSVVENTVLDVFLYPPETFRDSFNPADFVQIFDGNIVLDKNGSAESLKTEVLKYLENIPEKTQEELRQEIYWCKKMLARSSRGDAEGFYRWHWLLFDSLEIYFDLKRQSYRGPKKALRYMEHFDPEGYGIYTLALKEFTQASLFKWIAYLEKLI